VSAYEEEDTCVSASSLHLLALLQEQQRRRTYLNKYVLNEGQREMLGVFDIVVLVVKERTQPVAEAQGVDCLGPGLYLRRHLQHIHRYEFLQRNHLPRIGIAVFDIICQSVSDPRGIPCVEIQGRGQRVLVV